MILLPCLAAPAPSTWLQFSTAELELLTSGDGRVASDALAELARLRTEWRAAMAREPGAARPLRIIAFGSEAEYQPFRINAFSPAYFAGSPGLDTIVLGRLSRENFPALRHEFVHHLIRARWRKLPLWLEEGLADYFGGIEGEVAKVRMERLRRRGSRPVSELGVVGVESAAYRDREEALQFYAQSWAMVDLLLRSPAYREQAWACVERLNEGATLGGAIHLTYGRSLGQVDADLAAHVERLKPGRAVRQMEGMVAAPATADSGRVALALARLLLRKGDTGGAQGYLNRVPASARGNAELWSLTGDLALRQGRPLEALSALRKALELGTRDARALRQLAVLEQSSLNRTALQPVLARLLDVDPADGEARRALATLQEPR